MNAVEIEEALSELAAQPFDEAEFPFLFLEALGNKETTINRLRKAKNEGKGGTNASDILGGVLQRNNIHIAVCPPDSVGKTLRALRESPQTAIAKAKFILATDGITLEAEELGGGETIASEYPDFPKYIGFFLPLVGISTVKEIKDNPIDIKATGRLNKLYIELLKENPDWASSQRREAMNHFMARLIFCFFAEDTDIFRSRDLFTKTIEQMSEKNGSNTHEVMSEIFRAMNIDPIDPKNRAAAKLPNWADVFPYVNGDLFSGSTETPRFSRIARAYLTRSGELDWEKINPDIFGSMIQAIAEDEERGNIGMHYTSVPNILKVLNPLFLDDLRDALKTAGDNSRSLLNLRKRIANIRVFDPACGSGNFLVIAYKKMRAIEARINERRGETGRRTEISIQNFRGIELKSFPAEIARLALVIAEYQCDVRYCGQKDALMRFLPLDAGNWITCGNALRLDWMKLCPPTGTGVKIVADDLFETPLDQTEIDFENEGGETYICGNPPYLGSTWQSREQKADLEAVFNGQTKNWKSLDYVAGWFMKAADYGLHTQASAAFVSTNSICQGQQVPILWPLILKTGHEISFAYTSFKWNNLASYNAGVTVVIVGVSRQASKVRQLFSVIDSNEISLKEANNINAYLIAGKDIIIDKATLPISEVNEMSFGNKPVDGGHLLLSRDEADNLKLPASQRARFIRRFYGSAEFIRGQERYCLWIEDNHLDEALHIEPIRQRIECVREMRLASPDKGANAMALRAHQFREMNAGINHTITIPSVSSENREYLPCGLLSNRSVVSNLAVAIYDAPLWNMALIASRLHLVWIAAVCGKLETRYRYSNTLGWNTFPVPKLTEQNKADLTRCAENILLVREAHFPKTIADLYEPEKMPEDLRRAHEENDEVLERIYIGRRFRNDTERLETLFKLYTEMTSEQAKPPLPKKREGKRIYD